MTEQTEMTDAERLSAAEAAMAAAMEAAKAARLPSASAAAALLESAAAQAFVSELKASVEASVDDLMRPLGAEGSEGTKQTLQRIVTSFEGGLTRITQRVALLQPVPAPSPVEGPEPVT